MFDCRKFLILIIFCKPTLQYVHVIFKIKITHVKEKYAISTCYLKNYTMHVTWHCNTSMPISKTTLGMGPSMQHPHVTTNHIVKGYQPHYNPMQTQNHIMHGYQPNYVIPPCKLKTALCMDSDHAIHSCKPKTTLCLNKYLAISHANQKPHYA